MVLPELGCLGSIRIMIRLSSSFENTDLINRVVKYFYNNTLDDVERPHTKGSYKTMDTIQRHNPAQCVLH